MFEAVVKKKGLIAGNFDVIHPGYIRFFKDAKSHCDYLIIALHEDPTIERPQKAKPVLNKEERTEVLLSIKHIDEVVYYNTEVELLELLRNIKPHVRILGSDYRGKKFTGDNLGIPVHYHKRDHNWSTTKFKDLITEQVLKQRNVEL